MYVSFNQMPPIARVWIYQANRDFTASEKALVQTQTETFLNTWTAHQQTLKASYSIFYNRFLVIALDEDYNQASGCSIDASVHFLQKLEQELGLSLLDRSEVAYWVDDALKTEKLPNLKQKIKEGSIQANTPIFVNTVNNLADLNQNWQKPALNTWLSKYF
jgi:tRNA U34 5-methylaminomethyl-2-thiouridine-forming methyltransferase MnmC